MGDKKRTKRTLVKFLTRQERTTDTVWCPTTEHGTWIARRNGAVFVTGNSNANRAEFMRSNTARVLLLFRQYSQNITHALMRNAYLSAKGTAAQKTEARTRLMGILGMTGLLGGVAALPFYTTAIWVANAAHAIYGDDDEPWDATLAFRQSLNEMAGETGGSLIAKGFGGAGLSPRIALNQLWIRKPRDDLEGKALAGYYLEQAAGPLFGGIPMNVMRGWQLFTEGREYRGVEAAMPKAIKDLMKFARFWAEEGAETLKGDKLISDFDASELLTQAMGFTPARLAERYEQNNRLKTVEQSLLERRRNLINGYYLAYQDRNAEDMAKAREKIAAFNKTNGIIAITSQSLRLSLRARARYRREMVNGISLNPKLRAQLLAMGFMG